MTLHEHIQRQIAFSNDASLTSQLAIIERRRNPELSDNYYRQHLASKFMAAKELRYMRVYVRCMIMAPKSWRYRTNDTSVSE